MATNRVNLDVAQYVRVTPDPFVASSLLLQSHRDTIRLAFSNVQPAKSNPTFHDFQTRIFPDDQLTLSAAVTASPSAVMTASAVWQEDT